jgi:alkaline phosphatase D
MQRRDLLTTFAALPFIRHARAADGPRFALGVASGQPQPAGVVLWTRLTGPGLPAEVPVAWEVAHDEAFTRIVARSRENAVAADAHSVHAEPQGLQSDRWYWYRFSALGQRSMAGRTRTAPAPDADVKQLAFAIASCQRWDHGHYAGWRHAAAEELDLVLFLGDYIYEYGSARSALRAHEGGLVRSLAQYRDRYAQYKSDPALQAAHAACPWLVIWDDHEVDNDYAGYTGQTLQPDFEAQRAAAYQAWWEHMPVAKALRPQGGALRIFGSSDWGLLARIHLLDDRQYRDVQACPRPGRAGSTTVDLADCPELMDPRRSPLGLGQERWLADNWSLERPWNLLAQQTLMARWSWADPARAGGKGPRYWTDGWDGYPAARQRVLQGIAQRKAPGVVVLGGDVHANYVADLRADVGADFDDARSPVLASEFCGTSISSLGLAQERVDAARAYNPHVHWSRADQRGYVRFTLQRDQLHAQLRVLADALDANSSVSTAASFVVPAGKPGPQKA